MNDQLDIKLNEVFGGKVVRKDLLHRIKKSTNVPTFVLEFLLARYCASDDPEEIEAGIKAVFETLEKNYVRPDEANKAQSLVQQKGKHKFIDRVHVSYKERERRHWAEMENFGSQRIAISEKYYRDNERLLEGGIWAEVTVAHNDVEDEAYAFYIEDLRPIQVSRFDEDEFTRGREKFSRDEWMHILLRSFGMEPARLTTRLKFHFLSRLFCHVESNYNFIELGPRGTGKSYAFSEFSPYSTLISGGQASTATLFYNNQRRKVGLVGYWDTIAFDEVAGINIKDKNTVDILKDYMANGRFSRGAEVIANASLAFVGNIDHSIEQLVHSRQFDLFVSLPASFDLAVMDRFHAYMPGWEIPKNSSSYLTDHYGFITDYLAEAFHRLTKQSNRYEYVNSHCRFGRAIEGRDEKAVKKTVCALLKLLHPVGDPTVAELEEYMAYALEGRRRVKEQMNKRKPDDEFANINLSYIRGDDEEVIVWCPESQNSEATQHPTRKLLPGSLPGNVPSPAPKHKPSVPTPPAAMPPAEPAPIVAVAFGPVELKDRHFTIHYGDTGYTYESIMGEYLKGAKHVSIEDSYIRLPHQIQNLLRFCELAVRVGNAEQIDLVTGADDEAQKVQIMEKLDILAAGLKAHDIDFNYMFSQTIHDREISLDNGWTIKIGRGFDFYQKPEDWYAIGASDLFLRPCLETKVDIYRKQQP
jgi:ATP-dependent Lon protease